jgi:hypothetical protein
VTNASASAAFVRCAGSENWQASGTREPPATSVTQLGTRSHGRTTDGTDASPGQFADYLLDRAQLTTRDKGGADAVSSTLEWGVVARQPLPSPRTSAIPPTACSARPTVSTPAPSGITGHHAPNTTRDQRHEPDRGGFAAAVLPAPHRTTPRGRPPGLTGRCRGRRATGRRSFFTRSLYGSSPRSNAAVYYRELPHVFANQSGDRSWT